jgi:hypothetical protein
MGRPKGIPLSEEHKAKIRAARVRPGASSGGLATNQRHGMSGTPTWVSWQKMKQRCSTGKYSGLGVTVCDKWLHSFENFLADMGERPEGMTLDRIDPCGDYEPANCRWATADQQQKNTRRNKPRPVFNTAAAVTPRRKE